jgi:uncharacterized protein YifN (PemK superfamily)
MEIEDEVNKLVPILAPVINNYFDNYKLEELYTWRPFERTKTIFSEDEIKELSNNNEFINNVKLKHILYKKLSGNTNCENNDLYKWIIEKWGKITSFKQYDNIDLFLGFLEKNINSFPDGISSFSKIASFKYLNEYFIYDGHVSYVLNWLLLRNFHNNNKIKYFPFANSRNEDITNNYNLKTILTLANKKIDFYDKNAYYFIYCKLIKSIAQNNEKIKEPFYLEMMLFSILDIVIDEIRNNVKISIS